MRNAPRPCHGDARPIAGSPRQERSHEEDRAPSITLHRNEPANEDTFCAFSYRADFNLCSPDAFSRHA